MFSNDVWVVSYYDPTWAEPIVTVYDNEEAALAHYNYLKIKQYYKKIDYAIAIDKCPIYRTFKIVKKEDKRKEENESK